MNCPHCDSTQTKKRKRTTQLGYAMYRCHGCDRTFNERTGTPFNFIEIPTDIVFQVLLCRCRYKLSYRDVAELFLLRGFQFTHETVRDWEARFASVFGDALRAKRKGTLGKVWSVDETYVKVQGCWCYLYRGVDENGDLVDVRLSEKRDMEAAKAFFAQAQSLAEQSPIAVITDGHSSYPRAIREDLGPAVVHYVVGCVANPVEQTHRGIKQRYYPMLGFGAFESAQRFCQIFEEVHQWLRPRQSMGETVSLAQRREHVVKRVAELRSLFAPAV